MTESNVYLRTTKRKIIKAICLSICFLIIFNNHFGGESYGIINILAYIFNDIDFLEFIKGGSGLDPTNFVNSFIQ